MVTILHIEPTTGLYPDTVQCEYRAEGSVGWKVERFAVEHELIAYFARPEIAAIIGGTDPSEAARKATAFAAAGHAHHVAEQRRMDEIERTNRSVTATVKQDSAWWVAQVVYTATGRPVPRRADEGGTHAHRWMAESEADDRARRAAGSAGKITRVGYEAPTAAEVR